jgi:hypothetical protein
MSAPNEEDFELVHQAALRMVDYASQLGLNVSIEVKPHQPPKIGEHTLTINVWPKREFTRPEGS